MLKQIFNNTNAPLHSEAERFSLYLFTCALPTPRSPNILKSATKDIEKVRIPSISKPRYLWKNTKVINPNKLVRNLEKSLIKAFLPRLVADIIYCSISERVLNTFYDLSSLFFSNHSISWLLHEYLNNSCNLK